jgi:hypothetical protein
MSQSPVKVRSQKSKKLFDFPEDQIPVCNYDITADEMTALISRTSNFTKKQLQKVEKLANIPKNPPNSDL